MRKINNLHNQIIEQQEFTVNVGKITIENEYILAGVTALIACGLKL
jgi:hypothetical protein